MNKYCQNCKHYGGICPTKCPFFWTKADKELYERIPDPSGHGREADKET